MYKANKIFWLTPLTMLLLVGCSGTKETLGLERQAPDEFKVLKHAPLELPPNYALRPPRPGAVRPQEQEPSIQAKQTVFGNKATKSNVSPSSLETSLLQSIGANTADPNIREKLDSEAGQIEQDQRPVAKKILGVFGNNAPKGNVIDPSEELERLNTQKVEQDDNGSVTISE